MPQMSDATGFDSKPKVESLEEGETLSIISINPEVGKTPKNGYDIMYLNTAEHGEMCTMAKGIIRKLQDVLKAVEEDGFEFNEEDPLTCTVTTYTSKQGKEGCKALS